MEKKPREELISKNFVFETSENGEMSFVGNFEGLYAAEPDPWGQSGADDRMGDYYAYSRSTLLKTLSSLPLPDAPAVLEVGCGLGYVANLLHENLANARVSGMDISVLAVKKAKTRFKHVNFLVGDITSATLNVEERFNVVIIDQILWYVLGGLAELFDNVEKLLETGGFVVIVNAFIDEQKYGKEIIDGFDGLVKYVAKNFLGSRFNMIKAEVDCVNAFIHKDGFVVLQKTEKVRK